MSDLSVVFLLVFFVFAIIIGVRERLRVRSPKFYTKQQVLIRVGWAGTTSIVIGIIGLTLTVIGLSTNPNPAIQVIVKAVSDNFWDIIRYTLYILGIPIGYIIARQTLYFSLKRGLRHLEVWYFGRNNNPDRPVGDRVIRNTETKQAYIMDTQLDRLAEKRLVEWFNEPCITMGQFLESEKYTFNRNRPLHGELYSEKNSRRIKFLLWIYV